MHSSTSEYYSLGGITIRLVDAPPAVSAIMAMAFSLSSVERADAYIPMRCLYQDAQGFLEAMPAYIRDRYSARAESDAPLAFFGPSGEFTVLVKNFGTATYGVAAADDTAIDLYVQRLPKDDSIIHFQAVVVPIIKHLLLKQGKLLVHSGCVATPDGRAVLFVGHSGSGKTTSCMALCRSGFRFISDDLNVLSFSNGQAFVEGIREKMNLSRKTIGFFPELAPYADIMSRSQEYRWKLPVDPVELWGKEGICSKARIAAVVLLHIGKDGPRLSPCPVADILNLTLQNQRFETGLPISRDLMQVLWSILERTMTLNLHSGPDPASMGDFMADQFIRRPHPDLTVHAPQKNAETAPAPAKSAGSSGDPLTAAVALRGILSHSLDGDSNGIIVPALRSTAANRSAIARMFMYHRLESHLARWMKDTYPVDTMGEFSAERTLAHAQAFTLYVEQTAIRLHDALSGIKVPHLFLRGPVIAAAYYPDRSLRTYRDIDIIIPRPLLPNAAELMQRLGFQPNRDLRYWESKGEWPFSDGKIIVELHWHAYPMEFSSVPAFSTGRLLAAPDTVVINGVLLPCLPPGPLLLSSLLHAAYDHQLDRLVRLVDIRQIIKQAGEAIDWEWIDRMIRETGTAVAVAKQVECLESFIDTPHIGRLRKRLRTPRLAKRLADALLPIPYLLAGRGKFDRMRRKAFQQVLRTGL